MRLVFYDTETTGTDRDFDQILQFAAIATDENLRELDRFEIRCRRLPWIVPAPAALLVTGISPHQLDDPSLPTLLEMMEQVRSKLTAWSPAIFVGFNSMRFDEPLLQRAFWQTLLPPYLTVTNGNGRSDLLSVVRAASHLLKDALSYPRISTGRLTFRLDALAPLNGFSHNRAHDALGDVEATIHIARLIATRHPAFWSAILAKSRKSQVLEILEPKSPVLIADFTPDGPSAWWGCSIDDEYSATDSHAAIARLDFDWLRLTPRNEQQVASLFGPTPRVERLALNRSPLIFSEAEALSIFGTAPSAEARARAAYLRSASHARAHILAFLHTTRRQWPAPIALEQRMFEGFPNRLDADLMERFHSASWQTRADLVRAFADSRYRQLAQRLVYVGAPEHLDPPDREKIKSSICDRVEADFSSAPPWRSVPLALRELEDLKRERGARPIVIDIERWLRDLAHHCRHPNSNAGMAGEDG